MSRSKRGLRTRRNATVSAPAPDRSLVLNDLLNLAVARLEPVAHDLPPLAVVDASGQVLTRAEAARSMLMLAEISRLFAIALPEDELERMQASIEQLMVNIAADEIEMYEFGTGLTIPQLEA